ncbi:MAG: small multi-drug export protein [Chloroflexi bacterium]|nr:small multi-drug export protein [Chloroflexota bacterium]MBM3172452.1 small multi-drug export protein [Chloroflexota bacterium]MBM3175119.1 small multi-drug export protein [Chloroflexota bacterium]MBM4449774.1 small multi-drug export protein [Chloroflexota bacterium]
MEIIEKLISHGIAKELIVIIISALPIIELRGALPVAINLFGMPWYWALPLAVIGNMLPVPISLLFLDSIAKIVSKVDTGKKVINWVFERTRRREKIIQRYERIGLMLFVAIPLPFTGAWTGSIAAFLMGQRFLHSFLSIFCGVLIAGVIVTTLCLLGWAGAIIAGIGLSVIAILGWWKV